MHLPTRVRITEVGPRDGLQNEPSPVSVEARVELIEDLARAGLRSIECGSFVSPRWVPQMASTAEVLRRLEQREDITYSVLVPNLKGLAAAAECGVRTVAVFVSASEQFSQANTNCSVAEGLRKTEQVVQAASPLGIAVRGYVSCALGCPYEGAVPSAQVARSAQALHQMGCYEISLGDTIGVGTPLQARRMLETVGSLVPVEKLAVHYHDTWGQALANTLASLEFGVSSVDSSVAGLGGCPYAPGAAGNVATEDLVYMLHGLGIETGVDLKLLAAAGRKISAVLGREPVSKAAIAMSKSRSN